MLRQFITDDGDEHGGCGNGDVRRTNRMKAQHSSHSTDMVGSKNRVRSSRNSQPETQSLSLQILQRQNAASERKRVPLTPIQLRAVFSLFSSQ